MLVRRTEPVPVECVARGYLSGSGWKEYQRTGSVCGVALPAGLRESDRLPEPIFTPATKAESGHDINISEAEAGRLIDFLLSERFQSELPLNLFVYPANADVALPEVFTANATVPAAPLSVDPAAISANREAWLETWTDTVLR